MQTLTVGRFGESGHRDEPRADCIETAPIRDVPCVALDEVPEAHRWAGRSIETAGRASVLDPVRRQDFNRVDQADVTQRLGETPCASGATEPVGGSEEAVPIFRLQGVNSDEERSEACRELECLGNANPEPPEVSSSGTKRIGSTSATSEKSSPGPGIVGMK
jgi:hypothetical protein